MAAGELYLQALFQSDQRLRRFLLPNVRPTGRELGTGGYGTVEELEVNGLVCAGKKIHDAILQERNITKFVEECQLMSDLRHPHLVQFLGICFLPPSPLPVLVMEKLHSSLDGLLTQHTRHPPLLTAADIPLGLKRSFFVDTVKGLHFLHHHSPSPVIHRDLSAGNVLLTPSMVAKISDFGNARMMDLQPDQLARLTRVPGTPVYMPPEAHLNPPCYGPALDIFSLGHLMLYTLIQVFPWDLLPPTYTESRGLFRRGRLLARSELERREHYITQLHQQLGVEHPLVRLVEDCLANQAEMRPSAEEVLQQLEQMEIDDPYQNLTRLEMMRMVGQREEEIRQTVEESQRKDREIQQRDEELGQVEAEMGRKEQTIRQKEEEIQRMGEESRQKDREIQRRDEELGQMEAEMGRKEQTIRQKEEEIQRMGEESQRKDREIQWRDEKLGQMEAEMGQKEQTIQQKEEEIQRMGEEIQQRDVELGRKEDKLRQKEGEEQTLQSQVHHLETQVRRLKAVQRRDAACVESLRNQVHELESEKERTQAQHTSEVGTFFQRISALSEDNSALSSLVEANTSSLAVKEEQVEALRREVEEKEWCVKFEDEKLEAKQQRIDSVTRQAQAHVKLVHSLQKQLAAQQKSFQDQLSALQQQTEGVAQERDALQLELVSLREGLQTKDAEIVVQRERVRTTKEELRAKAAETTAKDALLQSKEGMVQSLWREVDSLRQRRPEQVPILHPGRVSLEWKQCAHLPVRMDDAQAVQLKNKVYVQGDTASTKTNSTIYTYEVPADAWVSMRSPAYWSALTIYHSQLVLVGGRETITKRDTDQLWVLQDEQTWTQPLPPMPTVRHSASVISLGDHLVVAGGVTGLARIDSVEVYDGVQWVRADPLPVACRDIKSTHHSGMWYLMGGDGQSTSVFYTSLQSLIEKATRQPPHSPDSSEQQSVWKTLPDVPYEYSSTTTLGGEALLTVGGMKKIQYKNTSSISMYCPLTRSWLHIGDVPVAVRSTCSISLTAGETMVIGGATGYAGSLISHVHKVSLKLQ